MAATSPIAMQGRPAQKNPRYEWLRKSGKDGLLVIQILNKVNNTACILVLATRGMSSRSSVKTIFRFCSKNAVPEDGAQRIKLYVVVSKIVSSGQKVMVVPDDNTNLFHF